MEERVKIIYSIVLTDYPDVLDVKKVSEILRVSTKTVYGKIRKGSLSSFQAGREFRVPKVSLMEYMKLFDSPVCEQATT